MSRRQLSFLACLIFLSLFCLSSSIYASQDSGCFKLCPWRVGQFAEYQIITYDQEGLQYTYRISVFDKKSIKNAEYFWLRLDISAFGKREIAIEALVPPFKSTAFAARPAEYISQGLMCLFSSSKQMKLILKNGKEYVIDKSFFIDEEDILRGTFEAISISAKNKVDYAKMEVYPALERTLVPAGHFNSYHFAVKTTQHDDFKDEGFDLWRSSDVPFLGIVKLEFSKTRYADKWKKYYNDLFSKGNLWSKIYTYLFVRRNLGAERSDMCVMKLLDYKS